MTSLWRGAWHIARYELRMGWGGLLVTFILFAYMVLMSFPLMDAMLDGEFDRDLHWLFDFVHFSILPSMGFLMNRSAFRYWKDDYYTKKLAMWHTMPIRMEQLVAGRLLLMLIVAVLIGMSFFGMQYAINDTLRQVLGPAAYLNYAITWFGFSIFWGVSYVYAELGLPGKKYFAACFGYIVLFALITLMINLLSDSSAVMYTIESAQAGNWLPPALTVIAAAAAVTAGSFLIKRRINVRSLWD